MAKSKKTPAQLQKELYEAWFNMTLRGVMRPSPSRESSPSMAQAYANANQKITGQATEALKRKKLREAAENANPGSLHKRQKTENAPPNRQDDRQDAANIRIAEQNKGEVLAHPIVIADAVTEALLNVAGIDTTRDSTKLALLEPVRKLISLIMENDHLTGVTGALDNASVEAFRQAISDLSRVISESIPPEKQRAISEALATVGEKLLSSAVAEYHGRHKALRDSNQNLFLEPAERVLNRAHRAGSALIQLGERIQALPQQRASNHR